MEFPYGEQIVVVPRKFPLKFKKSDNIYEHFAFIGVANVIDGTPLFFDGVNEKGLCIAALNFPGFAFYHPVKEGRLNLAPFEVIPRILGACKNVEEARLTLAEANICDVNFSEKVKNTPLHFMISDGTRSLVVESVEEGLKLYDNPTGTLTNSPPFPMQLFKLNDYMALTREPPENKFSDGLKLMRYSRGMGAMGLPGDFSSSSRFIRAVFIRENSVCSSDAREALMQAFHILAGAEQQRGCVHLGEGKYELTAYSACCDAAQGVYYYKTYFSTSVCAVDMRRENLDSGEIAVYPMLVSGDIKMQN